ncbi:MAG: hypothetical protein GC171_10390 [Terrimonas sp.]|nr:hypothetical protein [Terrimonas sp.]
MERRKFLTWGATGLSVWPVLGFRNFGFFKYNELPEKPDWLIKLIQLNDRSIEPLLSMQVLDKASAYYGGCMDSTEIATPQNTGNFISKAACAIASAESSYFRSPRLLEKVKLAVDYLLRVQHKDGTIDLLETNFHSPPDTAFSVEKIAPAYGLIKASGVNNADDVLKSIQQYLQRAGEALIVGGIHTPNHRWVVSAALNRINALWPDRRYLQRAEQWLAEHIDIDPDGQYTEKSTGGYTPLVDHVLITISDGMQKPEILDAVRKNLDMTMYYVHPNGEVVTEASNRQDKGRIGTLESYYFSYRYLALLDNNSQYAAMCRLIEKSCFSKLVGSLDALLEDASLWKELPAASPLPISYARAFPYSGVVRIRRDRWDATILSNNAGWLTFHKGDAVIQGIRIAASFFGKGQFQSSDIRKVGESWILYQQLEGVYYQPYPKDQIDPEGDLSKMPRSNRSKSEIQHLETEIKITETAKGISVDIEMKGTDAVPVTLELIFRPGGEFTGVQPHATKENAFLFSGPSGTYTQGKDTIYFGKGVLAHKAIQLRGALPAMEAPTVYLTGYTPFHHHLELS